MKYQYIFGENPIDHLPEKYVEVIILEEWTIFQEWQTSKEAMKLRRKIPITNSVLYILFTQDM